MHIRLRLIFLVVSLALTVHCQEKEKNGTIGIEGSIRDDDHRVVEPDLCTGNDCEHIGVIVGSVIGAHVVVILLIIGIYCCFKRYKGRPLRLNSTFVSKVAANRPKIEMNGLTLFQSGLWTSRWYQNGQWHGPYTISLQFDSTLLKVTGAGIDDLGTYTIDGIYSIRTRRMGFTKAYQPRNTSSTENLTTIQLVWNLNQGQFEGKWYVRTSQFHGENQFKLKFESSTDEQVNNVG